MGSWWICCVAWKLQFRTHKVIYRRYAGLFFSLCVDITDNELAYLECIHLFVEILDHFFSNVCELDLVFNFHKVCCFCNLCYLWTWWFAENIYFLFFPHRMVFCFHGLFSGVSFVAVQQCSLVYALRRLGRIDSALNFQPLRLLYA